MVNPGSYGGVGIVRGLAPVNAATGPERFVHPRGTVGPSLQRRNDAEGEKQQRRPQADRYDRDHGQDDGATTTANTKSQAESDHRELKACASAGTATTPSFTVTRRSA